jgi:glycosyltransferase involved in cell wall biosynthesis
MAERIGFISTRFAGTDGVSLESAKWAQLLWDYKHVSFWYAGLLDRSPDISMCVPEAYFAHPEIDWINQRVWGRYNRSPHVTRRINEIAEYLKYTLYEFIRKFDITILCLQNALTIPMHIPLGVALTELISETRIPAIAHHHDFYWERDRFMVNAVPDYLEMAFPPRNDDIQHVVINQTAQEDLSWRKGVSSLLVPNVFDFESPAPMPDEYSKDVKSEIGLEPDDVMILQPTRIVARKGIEHSINLVKLLGNPKYKLVISHEAGDEGYDYQEMLAEHARESGVDIRFVSTRIGERRQMDKDGNKIYTLWDLYPHADLVTYPSIYEGFGNAFLEAIYFRVPIIVNRYSIFARDIEPKGFRLPVMNGFVTKKLVDKVRRLIEDEAYRHEVVEHDYEVATRYYSYSVLRRKLRTLITNITGLERL